MMVNSQDGGSSLSHIFHHSLFISAPSSETGFCMYWAFQYRISNAAFFASNSSTGQNSGQSASPSSLIAGNSTTSHLSTSSLRSICVTIIPVRSSLDQRVITTIIAPPGIRRCKGPDWNHSQAGRNTSGLPVLASCSE